MQTLGIDLGTTNSAIASGGRIFPLLEDERGAMPSVVAFLPNGTTQIGVLARRRRVIDYENTIASSKRIIGRDWSDPMTESFRERYRYRLSQDEHGRPGFETRAGRFTPVQIASAILREVHERSGVRIDGVKVRITIPAIFASAQRDATLEAARLAGLEDVELVSESLATVYAYLPDDPDLGRTVVYDLGGGTFDCSVVECRGGEARLLGHASDLCLGGDDIDEQLGAWVARHVLEKHNWDLTNYSEIYDRLVARCEEVKISLSQQDEAELALSQVDPECPAAAEGVTVTRRLLGRLCEDLVRRTFSACDEALRSASLRPSDVDTVLLAGGTTRLPVVKESVKTYFGRPGRIDVDPTEVVARGASLTPV